MVFKVTWADFVSFAFICHFFSHSWILFKLVCSLCVAITESSCVAKTALSPAKVAVTVSAVVGRSAV